MYRITLTVALSALWLIATDAVPVTSALSGSAQAATKNLNSSRSNIYRTTTVKSSKSNTSDRTTTVKSSKSNTSDRKGQGTFGGQTAPPWGQTKY
jgi:hypothetical protein